jgi:hypothetical protein
MGLYREEKYMEFVTSWAQEGIQIERRAGITKLLQLRFGEIDTQLEAIIPKLMELSTEEYMDLIYRSTREELLSQFPDN